MPRESFAAPPKQGKQHSRKGWDTAERRPGRDAERSHPSAKAQRSYVILQAEARQQIRELQSGA